MKFASFSLLGSKCVGGARSIFATKTPALVLPGTVSEPALVSWPLLTARFLQFACLLSLVWWGLKFFPSPPVPPAQLVDNQNSDVALDKAHLEASLQTMLGLAIAPGVATPTQTAQNATEPDSAEGLKLLGIVTQSGAGGAALLAAGTEPPRPYLVGTQVTPEWRLAQVDVRFVILRGPRGSLNLSLPDKFNPGASPSNAKFAPASANSTPHPSSATTEPPAPSQP